MRRIEESEQKKTVLRARLGLAANSISSPLDVYEPAHDPLPCKPYSSYEAPAARSASVGSTMSGTSHRSVDHRGPRRGRKGWESSGVPDSFRCLLEPANFSAAGSRVRSPPLPDYPIFCTWPSCQRTFKYKWEWARHEEAKHYCPYFWVCCLDEPQSDGTLGRCFICETEEIDCAHYVDKHFFTSCSGKNHELRRFLREDQLAQHIKGTHLKDSSGKKIPKALLAAWKVFNPSLSRDALYCGFCIESFTSWKDRQDHLWNHMQGKGGLGSCAKSSWIPLERDTTSVLGWEAQVVLNRSSGLNDLCTLHVLCRYTVQPCSITRDVRDPTMIFPSYYLCLAHAMSGT